MKRLQLLQLLTAAAIATQVYAGTKPNTNIVTGLTLHPDVDAIGATWTVENYTNELCCYWVTWHTETPAASCWVTHPVTSTDGCTDLPEPLDTCTAYTVTVQPKNYQDGLIGVAASARDYTLRNESLDITPTCTAGFNSSDALQFTVSWEVEGECTVFEVSWEGTILWSDTLDSPTGTTTTRGNTVQVNDPVPYTVYNVSVEWTDIDGVMTAQCIYTTPQTAPGPPTNVTAVPQDSSSVNVSWRAPLQENGELLSYTLQWGVEPQWKNISLNSTVTEHQVTELEACVMYDFIVIAVTGGGDGKEGATTGNTFAEAPPPPDPVTCDSTAGVVTVTWSTPDSKCDINAFDITWLSRVLWTSDHMENGSAVVTADYRSYDLNDTVPYTEYTVEVRAQVLGTLTGEPSNCTTETQQAAPSAPLSLSLNSTSHKSLTVNWQRPDSINGVLTEYLVKWALNGSEEQQGSAEMTENLEAKILEYVINGLQARNLYNVSVQAKTNQYGKAVDEVFKTEEKKMGAGAVIGIVVAAVVVTVLVAAVVVAAVKRDNVREIIRQRQKENANKHNSGTRTTPSLKEKQYLEQLLRGVAADVERLRNPEALQREFSSLAADSYVGSTQLALQPGNIRHNRYTNILPFDDTRVILQRPGDTDYINASYIEPRDGPRFIACQGPQDDQVEDFWWLVWENSVRTVVMLTKCEEGGKVKCSQYWPSSDRAQVSSFSLILEGEEYLRQGLTKRCITLQQGNTSRSIVQFHYTEWPVFGVPPTEDELLALLTEVQTDADLSTPIVVHSSAGAGRTGIFIGLWLLRNRAQRRAIPAPGVREVLLEMREKRMHFVQFEDQYLYLNTCFAASLRDLLEGDTKYHPQDSTSKDHALPPERLI